MVQHRVIACLFISFSIHFFILQLDILFAEPRNSPEKITFFEDGSMDARAVRNQGITLGRMVEEAMDASGDARMDRQVQAEKWYLSQVRRAIEERKFLSSGQRVAGLIGNVQYVFTITADDVFRNVRLVRSSGDVRLDSAARSAIQAASGVVERPALLGRRTFRLVVTVKYQYQM